MIKGTAFACVLVMVAAGVAACNSGNAGAVQCFAKGVDSSGAYASFSIQVLGASDCTNIANAASLTLGGFGYKVTPNTGKATGSEICSGVVSNYPVNIYGPAGDTGLCTYLGIPAVP